MSPLRLPLVAAAAALRSLVPDRASASDDARFRSTGPLQRIGGPAAWAASTGAGVRIGIVHTGVDLDHEDLVGKIVAHTCCIGATGDFGRCFRPGSDEQGHGTHISGIGAAVRDNDVGVAGVAPDAELVVAKVLGAAGSGATEDINAGIRWVVDNHGARVAPKRW